MGAAASAATYDSIEEALPNAPYQSEEDAKNEGYSRADIETWYEQNVLGHKAGIVQVSVGSSGNRIGASFWEAICQEHGVDAAGAGAGPASYFNETSDGRFVPRSVLVHADKSGCDATVAAPLGKLFRPDNHVYGEATGGNWAKGFYTSGAEIVDACLDVVRREAEQCDRLAAFQVCHALGGGTGGGLGPLLLTKIAEEYPDRVLASFAVLPGSALSESPTQPYNAVAALLATSDARPASKLLAAALFARGPPSAADVEAELAARADAYVPTRAKLFDGWAPPPCASSISGAVSSTAIANSTAVRQPLNRVREQMTALFRKKAFVHNYTGEGMDEMEFCEAESNAAQAAAPPSPASLELVQRALDASSQEQKDAVPLLGKAIEAWKKEKLADDELAGLYSPRRTSEGDAQRPRPTSRPRPTTASATRSARATPPRTARSRSTRRRGRRRGGARRPKSKPVSNNPDDVPLLQELSRKDAELHLALSARLYAKDDDRRGRTALWQTGCLRLKTYVDDARTRVVADDAEDLGNDQRTKAKKNRALADAARSLAAVSNFLWYEFEADGAGQAGEDYSPRGDAKVKRRRVGSTAYDATYGKLAKVDAALSCDAFTSEARLAANRPEWPPELRGDAQKFASLAPKAVDVELPSAAPMTLPPKPNPLVKAVRGALK
ncbi:hypothetical protein JL720_4726 [Aureococcus anophagefferens]|nr:hypothetical protein JL720_4726 [Aureococcus anophagefferens]